MVYVSAHARFTFAWLQQPQVFQLSVPLSVYELTCLRVVLDNKKKQDFFIPQAAHIQRGVKVMETGCHK